MTTKKRALPGKMGAFCSLFSIMCRDSTCIRLYVLDCGVQAITTLQCGIKETKKKGGKGAKKTWTGQKRKIKGWGGGGIIGTLVGRTVFARNFNSYV